MKNFIALMTIFLILGKVQADNCGFCNELGRFDVGVDWLYWKSYQTNLDYAILVQSEGDMNENRLISPKFQASSGYRLYAGYRLCCDPSWQTHAIFTHHGTSVNTEERTLAIGASGIVTNLASFPISGLPGAILSTIDSRWSSRLNYFDLDLEHTILCNSCLEICPHLGLRVVWLKQKLNLGGTIESGEGGTLSTSFRQRYTGGGLEGGLNGRWHLYRGFSLVGHLGGSLLFTRINVKEISTQIVLGTEISTAVPNTNRYLLTPMFDGFVGFEYSRCICQFPCSLHLGWEQHLILNANNLTLVNYGHLSMQGLTLGAQIGF